MQSQHASEQLEPEIEPEPESRPVLELESTQNTFAYPQTVEISKKELITSATLDTAGLESQTAHEGIPVVWKPQWSRYFTALRKFKATGAFYTDELGTEFPIFEGPAPLGHPYPAAWGALNHQ